MATLAYHGLFRSVQANVTLEDGRLRLVLVCSCLLASWSLFTFFLSLSCSGLWFTTANFWSCHCSGSRRLDYIRSIRGGMRPQSTQVKSFFGEYSPARCTCIILTHFFLLFKRCRIGWDDNAFGRNLNIFLRWIWLHLLCRSLILHRNRWWNLPQCTIWRFIYDLASGRLSHICLILSHSLLLSRLLLGGVFILAAEFNHD